MLSVTQHCGFDRGSLVASSSLKQPYHLSAAVGVALSASLCYALVWLLLLVAAVGCCCWLLLLVVLVAAVGCCCWLLLLVAAVDCCCWLLLLLVAAAGVALVVL
jgi:hypothetical protein